MNETFGGKFNSDEQEDSLYNAKSHQQLSKISFQKDHQKKNPFLDPPIDLPKKSYSLEPDMATGWKPKKSCKSNLNNVFSINYQQYVVDEIVKDLYKSKRKGNQTLVYLGARKANSYLLHDKQAYSNPYPTDKKLQSLFPERPGIPHEPKLKDCFLEFDSRFEGGNLDTAIQIDKNQFDLFMRVDTNTRGHTNWFYFSVKNREFIGNIVFNICNFRRQKSLYQRGLKPYIFSDLQDKDWKQGGKDVKYERKKLRYDCLYDEDDDPMYF